MRVAQELRFVAWVSLASVMIAVSPALAEDTCPAGTLGVSRTVEVDTTGGPWFGEPHGDRNLLAPGEVVLTFDDGPSPKNTRAILAALAKECIKATFFVVGSMVVEHPDVLTEMRLKVIRSGRTPGHTPISQPCRYRRPHRKLRRPSTLRRRQALHQSRRFSATRI